MDKLVIICMNSITNVLQHHNDILATTEKSKIEFDKNTDKNDPIDQLSHLLIEGLLSPMVITIDKMSNMW